jgi:hypothetical protein
LFDKGATPETRQLGAYLKYLESHYGIQSRPIYYALRPVVKLMSSGQLNAGMSWEAVSALRAQARTGRQRAACDVTWSS